MLTVEGNEDIMDSWHRSFHDETSRCRSAEKEPISLQRQSSMRRVARDHVDELFCQIPWQSTASAVVEMGKLQGWGVVFAEVTFYFRA